MFCRAFCLVLALILATVLLPTEAAPVEETVLPQDPVIRFHPVSQEQYDRILKLSGVKENAPFELRHLQFDFKPFVQWRTSISNDFSTGWHRLLNFAGLERNDDSESHNNDSNNNNDDVNDNNNNEDDQVNGYPLCVVKTADVQGLTGDGSVEGRRADSYEGVSFGDSDLEQNDENNGRPVVNCVVVLKPKKTKAQQQQKPQQQPQQQYHYEYYGDGDVGEKPGYAAGRPDVASPYPYSYYPMHDYGAYPTANDSVEEEEKPQQDEENRRRPASKVKAKSPKIDRKTIARPNDTKKSAMKSQSRQAYTAGYAAQYLGGYPQQSAIVGGYPYHGYGQSQYLGQSGYANPLVMQSNLFGAPGAYSPYGDYGYGVSSMYNYDDDDDESGEEDEEDEDNYHYDSDNDDDYYSNDDGYDDGYAEDHYYGSDNYRSLKLKKNSKKHV